MFLDIELPDRSGTGTAILQGLQDDSAVIRSDLRRPSAWAGVSKPDQRRLNKENSAFCGSASF
jgi:hypothetical protein